MALSRVADFFRETAALIILAGAFLVLSGICQYYSAGLDVHLQIESQTPDYLTIFWRSDGEPYDIERSWIGPIGRSQHTTINTTLPMAMAIDYIRIDAGNRPGQVVFHSASLSAGNEDVLDLVDSLNKIPPNRSNHLRLNRQPNKIILEAIGNDPFFEVEVPLDARPIFDFERIIPALLLFCLLISLLTNPRFLKGPKNNGTLKLSLPNRSLLRLPEGKNQPFQLGTKIFRNPGEHATTYSIEVACIEPRAVAQLLDAVKQLNTPIDLRFDYRRSGDV